MGVELVTVSCLVLRIRVGSVFSSGVGAREVGRLRFRTCSESTLLGQNASDWSFI